MGKSICMKDQLKQIDTLCFDLDGTLVEMNPIFKILLFVAAILRLKNALGLKNFYPAFKNAVKKIVSNQTEKTNYEIFIAALNEYSKSKMDLDKEIETQISKILTHDFPPLKVFFSPVAQAAEIVILARQLGYRLILATNPVFPLAAIKVRLQSAGFRVEDFEFITHAENMTRAKPRVAYYQELVNKLKLNPECSLMIGNDPRKDLPAFDVGMKTFLVETDKNRHLIYKVKDERITIRGNYKLLMELLKAKGPVCRS